MVNTTMPVAEKQTADQTVKPVRVLGRDTYDQKMRSKYRAG